MDYKPVVYACITSQSGHVILRERDPAMSETGGQPSSRVVFT